MVDWTKPGAYVYEAWGSLQTFTRPWREMHWADKKAAVDFRPGKANK